MVQNMCHIHPPSQTAWYRQNSRNDAGNSKKTGIYREGNIGVGPTAFAPTAKIDLRSATAGGGLRLVDGTQGENKVLSSDANGNASWVTNVAVTPAVLCTLIPVGGQVSQNTYTGGFITLPNGKWFVQVNMLTICHLATDNIWTRTGFSTSTTVNEMATGSAFIGPRLISALIHGNGVLNMLSGTIIINNTTGGDVTYYYWLLNSDNTSATFTDFSNSNAGENSIEAYPMN